MLNCGVSHFPPPAGLHFGISKYPLVNNLMGSWFLAGLGSPFVWHHQVSTASIRVSISR
jgi:hypothetical protein